LGRELWIDAGRSKKEELLDSCFVGSVDHVVLDLKIVVDEVSWKVAVCDDATHFSRRKDDVIWFLSVKEFLDLGGVK
jgi:hypothetical protein